MEAIVLRLPAALKPLADLVTQLVTFTEAACEHARTDAPFAYPAVERSVAAFAAALQTAVHGAILAACDRGAPRLLIDGEVHRPVLVRAATYYTLGGPVVVTRTLYRPAHDAFAPTLDPIGARIGVVGAGWLPQAATAMAFLVQLDPSRDAARAAHLLGVLPYSRASFDRVTKRVGDRVIAERERVEEALIRAYAVPAAATGIAVSLDRVATPMEEPRRRPRGRPKKGAAKRPVARVWRMAYCATVTLHDAQGRALHTVRYGRMPGGDTDGLVLGLRDDVLALRAQRPDLHVSLLCDGAAEMWTLLGGQFTPETLECALSTLVDLWHLLEKLGKAARRKHDEARASELVARWKLRLLNRPGAWEQVRAEIAAWGLEEPASHGRENRSVHDALTFLTNQGEAGRLDYAAARAAGRPVGSGPVEATCKSLFNVRMKRSGARWKDASGECVVRLRALHLSGRWDDALDLTLQASRREIRRAS